MIQQVLPLNLAFRIDSFLVRVAAAGLRVKLLKLGVHEFHAVVRDPAFDRLLDAGAYSGVPIRLVRENVWTS